MRLSHFTAVLLAITLLPVGAAEPIWVSVGYGGRRLSSRDGQNWEHDQRWSDESKDNDDVLFDVAYGFGRFIAVGGGAKIGHILSTKDGVTWNELPRHRGRIATIAFGRDRFVAAHDAELLYSLDGESFAVGQKLDWKGSIHARKSVFGDGEGGGMFVIIGDVDLHQEGLRVSWRAGTADGVAFAKAEHHTPDARDIAFGGGHFVVVGPKGLIESSHDGLTWVRRESDPEEDFQSIVWTGVRFIAQGRSTWTSSEGLTWRRKGNRIEPLIAWANEASSHFSIRGIALSWGGSISFSPDLGNWAQSAVPPGPSLTSVAVAE